MKTDQLRYIFGPIVYDRLGADWASSTPEWMRTQVLPARIRRIYEDRMGDDFQCSYAEVLLYLMTASLAGPLDHEHTSIYLHVGYEVMSAANRNVEGFDELICSQSKGVSSFSHYEKSLLVDFQRKISRASIRQCHYTKSQLCDLEKTLENSEMARTNQLSLFPAFI